MESYQSLVTSQREFFRTNQTKNVAFRLNALEKLRSAVKLYEQEFITALKDDLNKSEFEAYSTEIGIILEELRLTINKLPSVGEACQSEDTYHAYWICQLYLFRTLRNSIDHFSVELPVSTSCRTFDWSNRRRELRCHKAVGADSTDVSGFRKNDPRAFSGKIHYCCRRRSGNEPGPSSRKV